MSETRRFSDIGRDCKKVGLLFMAAKGGHSKTCIYCSNEIEQSSIIAGGHGIKWGHGECVLAHYNDWALILSPNNKEMREQTMLNHSNRVWSQRGGVRYLRRCGLFQAGDLIDGKVWNPTLLTYRQLTNKEPESSLYRVDALALGMSTKFEVDSLGINPSYIILNADYSKIEHRVLSSLQETAINKYNLDKLYDGEECDYVAGLIVQYPPSNMFITTCKTFSPQVIGPVVIMPGARPSEFHCELEMSFVGETSKRMWSDTVTNKIDMFKRRSRELPRCQEHSGRWKLNDGTNVQVGLKVRVFKALGYEWMRYLWWECPGHPLNWDGNPGMVF